MIPFHEFLNESTTHDYIAVAVVRNSPTHIQPVAKDSVQLTDKQVAYLDSNATAEKIQGDTWIVLDRENLSKLKAKTPTITRMGRTSGYTHVLFQKL